MLKSEWTGFISVAVETELVLGRGGAQLVRQESAMGVVAVAARQQAFIYFVMEWLGEIGFHIEMA